VKQARSIMTIRLGAVGHLDSRPLTYGLDRQGDRFSVRFDVPSRCATLLHEKAVDVGLIPAIEYLQSSSYLLVPDVAIASMGPMPSVALFSPVPTAAIRSIAIDSGSRGAAALLLVLCAQWFDIEPKLLTLPPDLPSMLKRCDAALLIGDTALFTDHDVLGLERIDLAKEWMDMTGLPFVHALWAGRPGALSADGVAALRAARDEGQAHADEIVQASVGGDDDKTRRALECIRENASYRLGEPELAGLRKFLGLAVELRIAPHPPRLQFF
jgi:chorismate dehydratase